MKQLLEALVVRLISRHFLSSDCGKSLETAMGVVHRHMLQRNTAKILLRVLRNMRPVPHLCYGESDPPEIFGNCSLE